MRRALLLLVLCACARAATGPQPILWDREACTHCRMLISDPAFAAQAIGEDGRPRSFDDPGCLFAWLADGGRAREVWFRDVGADRWLRADRAAFVRAPRTPMGYGMGAVAAGTPGALPYEEVAHGARP